MNRRDRAILTGVFLILLLLLIIGSRQADGREVHIRDAQGRSQVWDLTDMRDRAEFRAIYGNDEGAVACMDTADYALALHEGRDAGETEAEHLAEVRANYDASRLDEEGAVAWHIYVDFQRMVRDIHRRGPGGYVVTDKWITWEREVWWCVLPGQTVR